MTKKQMTDSLLKWGYVAADFEDLSPADLKTFYKKAEEAEVEKTSAVDEGTADSSPDNAESESGVGDESDSAPQPADIESIATVSGSDLEPADIASDAGDESDSTDNGDTDLDIDGDLCKAKTCSACEFKTPGLLIVGDKEFVKGKFVRLEEGQYFACEESVLIYLSEYRLAAKVED